MNTTVQDALKKLDPKNDNHWTADGLPRMDTVQFLAGDKSLTRDDITKAIPGFTRATAATATPPQGAEPVAGAAATTGTPETPPAASAPVLEPVVAGDDHGKVDTQAEAGNEVAVVELDDKQAQIAALEEKLADAQDRMAQIEQAQVQLNAHRAETNAAIERATNDLESVRGKETSGDAIRGYLDRQKLELQARADHNARLRENGIDLNALAAMGSSSNLDRAMARKTGYGTKRPGSK